MFVHGRGEVHATPCIWRTKDSFVKLGHSFHFYMGSADLSSGCQAWVASAFTHWTISPVQESSTSNMNLDGLGSGIQSCGQMHMCWWLISSLSCKTSLFGLAYIFNPSIQKTEEENLCVLQASLNHTVRAPTPKAPLSLDNPITVSVFKPLLRSWTHPGFRCLLGIYLFLEPMGCHLKRNSDRLRSAVFVSLCHPLPFGKEIWCFLQS